MLLASAVPLSAASALYTFDLDGNPGWATTGGWAWGAPLGTNGDPPAGYTGDYVYGNYLGADYPPSIAAETLTTTALDCTSSEGTTLTFRRWLGVENNNWDQASISVSNDGGDNWTTIWANPGTTINDTYWQLCSFDIADLADGQSDVRIRWTLGPTDSSVNYHGWNIDDIQIWSGAPTLILAWTAYTDLTREYPNTVAALNSVLADCLVMETPTTSTTTLTNELKGKHVFLIPEQENASSTDQASLGATFATVLENFVRGGGTMIDCGESDYASGLMNGTGLMSLTVASSYYDTPTTLSVVPDSGSPSRVGPPVLLHHRQRHLHLQCRGEHAHHRRRRERLRGDRGAGLRRGRGDRARVGLLGLRLLRRDRPCHRRPVPEAVQACPALR